MRQVLQRSLRHNLLSGSLEVTCMKQLKTKLTVRVPKKQFRNQLLRSNSPLACLVSSLACCAVMLLAIAHNRSVLARSEAELSKELAKQVVANLSSSVPTRDATGIFVEQMIKREFPALEDGEKIARIIVTESRKADIDPLFVAAVVRAESMFRHKATSHRGAKGLMQIMPETGQYLAKRSKIELKQINDLHDPETNIKLGVWYLKHLEQRFEGSREKLLVAYNWGPTNLRRATSQQVRTQQFTAQQVIPQRLTYPKESVQYVQKVLSHHTLWTNQFAQYSGAAERGRLG